MVLFSSLNQSLFTSIHSLSGQYVFLDTIGIFFASYLQYVMVGALLALFFFAKNKREYIAMVLVAILSAFTARYVLKTTVLLFYAEPRPFVFFDFTPLITTPINENLQSFPSGHALFFFALAMGVGMFNKRYGIFFFIGALLMGVGRVYTGVHWPLDIVFGACIGSVVGFLIFHVYRAYAEGVDELIARFVKYIR